ncbi:MAG: CehA/McbA family metallohydrolase [Anaerolineaceae bacterium]|nr:CehA/McbA family metallohydrolase [Anaerolineaceae bacterium]
MHKKLPIQLFIDHQREGSFFTLPFTMPADIESLTLAYHYERHTESDTPVGSGSFVSRQEVNIIDLGLIAPDGVQVGASGSDKSEISISETYATPGYRRCPLVPGVWQMLVGAYKVAPQGVTVSYDLSFTQKYMRLLKGDLHTHTLASDGVLTAEELGRHAQRHGLDFLAITDHNQMVSADSLPQAPGLTLIPGVEWTHYQGHANFLGVDRPYDAPFFANTLEEIGARFRSARERGALITVNHPFQEGCGFQFDLNSLPFDCLEIWNGPMRESNLQAAGLWQSLLAAGKKVPISGGSDYHRDSPFQMLGGPTTCVYAMSSGPSDILSALKQGHAYLTFAPNGPMLELSAGKAMMGDSVAWSKVRELQIVADGLLAGDILRVVTARSNAVLLKAPAPGRFQTVYPVDAPGFARVEILRSFLPGIPMLPALISNPIYFDDR